jgi:hypothetical protein
MWSLSRGRFALSRKNTVVDQHAGSHAVTAGVDHRTIAEESGAAALGARLFRVYVLIY